ncbi:MAG: DUF4886 domain-containing protein [Clostridia bacterium]|nr:DUF4886 domain-containing protein [Clostridia bacterium]
MIRVLAIGNSFSDDARTFVHQIGKAAGAEITIGNLYIGGCSLERHWQNAREDAKAYDYSKTGCENRPASIREALEEEAWDYVTMQQASHFSGLPETYQPYLNELSAYVRRYASQAEQLIHETWAYEIDSAHPAFPDYGRDQARMYELLRAAYDRAAQDIGGARVIPSGDAFQIARRHPLFDYAHGGQSLNRDGFHASLTKGRYLLGCVWVETLAGVSAVGNAFVPSLPDQPELTPSPEELVVLQRAAHEAVMARRPGEAGRQ